MDNAMFCFQCEQTVGGKGCTKVGVCSKTPDVAKMQDVLIFLTKGIGFYGTKLVEKGEKIPQPIGEFFTECVFATLTNVNFDEERFLAYIKKANEVKKDFMDKVGSCDAPDGADYIAPETIEEIINIPPMKNLGVMDDEDLDMDVRSLRELLIYGVKGTGAYFHHAYCLGKYDDEVAEYMFKAMGKTLDLSVSADEYFELNMNLGRINFKCMELLDAANTGAFGNPEPTEMLITHKKGPFIVVSGHDLHDLGDLLEQSEGKGINIYTHGEMLPCNAYPGLKKYKHLIGNFGGAWQDQQKEFDNLPGAILMTSNCLMKPRDSYKDRIFTSSIVGFPGIQHISSEGSGKKDFSAVIEKALSLPGFAKDEEERRIPIGFAHNAVLSNAEAIVGAVKEGKIRHFFLIGGCDGARPGRNYFTKFAEQTPQDTIILTLACGKYRFNKIDLGTCAGFPRVLDCGQCNDAYSAIKIALALADAFECGVNDLPLSLIISWYEQKAVAVLLTLLYLGLEDIRLGPSLPAFVTPNVLQVLIEKFSIKPISTPEDDLEVILG